MQHNSGIVNALTIDVEDSINIILRDYFSIHQPPTDRVVENTRKIIDLLSGYNVTATFFVLGEVAASYPYLVKEIHAKGHELGVHGYDHVQFFRMDRAKAFDQISRAKKIIEDLTGNVVYGHRAPAFSITPETAWGLEVIAEAGFRYDSSVVPFAGSRYGWPGFVEDIHVMKLENGGKLIEAPLPTVKIFGKAMPVCGGGYLRHYPYRFSKWAMNAIIKKRPVVVYMHPYEIDSRTYPDFLRIKLKEAPLRDRLSIYLLNRNNKTLEYKIEKYLTEYNFNTLAAIIKDNLKFDLDSTFE